MTGTAHGSGASGDEPPFAKPEAVVLTRGIRLTILLSLITCLQLVVTVMLVATVVQDLDRGRTPLPVAALALLGLVGLVGAWAWYRWGVHLFVVTVVIGFVTDAVAVITSPTLLLGRLVLVVLALILIRRRWALFD